MNEDLEEVSKDIRNKCIQATDELRKAIDKAFSGIPKLEFPEIPFPKYVTEIQLYLESLPKPAIMEIEHLSAVTEIANEYFEEREKAFAPFKRQLEIAGKLSSIGERGWTALPGTYFESYMDCPVENQEETDAYFLELLTDDVVNSLFSEIVSMSDAYTKDDIIEAIDDYNDGRYKSSALIVFGLIDRILISNHKGEIYDLFKQTKRGKRQKGRPVGEAAANNIIEYFGQTPASFHFYHYVELKSCLPKLFIWTDDFSIPEDLINRNLVSHGMMKRKVEKKDCLQLFLLFRNFTKYIEDYNERFGSDQICE